EAIRHYIHQEVWDAAKRAILDLTEIAPDAPEVTEFIAAVSAGQVRAAAAKAAPPAAAFADEIVAPPPAPPPARPAPPVRAREPEVPEFTLEVPSFEVPREVKAQEPLAEFGLEPPAESLSPAPPPPPPPSKEAPREAVRASAAVPSLQKPPIDSTP